MHDILSARHEPTLADFACSSVLVAFDYDGTLAPIAAEPAAARMRATTRRLLGRVAACYPCVVISGRAHADVTRHLGQIPLWHIFGNHGLEPWGPHDAADACVKLWTERLRERLMPLPGVSIEDKTYSVTIHYRACADKTRARALIARAVRGLPHARPLGGKMAVNLIPRDGVHKGIALQRARGVLGCDTAIYVGDDDTDEDAFASAPRNELLAIRVGAARGSRAAFCLRSQRDIDRLLERLVGLRAKRNRVESKWAPRGSNPGHRD